MIARLRWRQEFLPGVVITILAALLRFYQLDWGLPDCREEAIPLRKAWGFWAWGEKGFDFNPHFFNYPSFYFYLQFLVQAILRAAGEVSGFLPDADAFRAAYYLQPSLFLYAGRALTALLGSATVFLLYRLAWRVGGRRVAIPASLFLAFHAVHLEKSRFLEVDVPMVFFVTLSYLFLVRFVEKGRLADLMGAAASIGLGAATKYPAALFLLNIPLSVLLRGRPYRLLPLAAALGLGALCFALASPYLLLDFGGFRRDFSFEIVHMRVGHFGGAGGGILGAASVFADGFGVPLLLAASVGLVIALRPPLGKMALFAAVPIALFALLSTSQMQARHYPLPSVAPLALLAAVAVGRLVPQSFSRGKYAIGAATLLLLLPAGSRFVDHTNRIGKGDTREKARDWIEENIAPGALILMEPHGPQLFSMAERERFEHDPSFRSIRRELLSIDRPAFALATIPSFSVEVSRSERFYRLGLYQWFDCVVLSSFLFDRYRQNEEDYPVQNRFYDELKRRFHLLRAFDPGEGTGPRLEIYQRIGEAPEQAQIRLDPTGRRDKSFLSFVRALAALYEGHGLTKPSRSLHEALLELQPNDPMTLSRFGTALGQSEGPEAGIPLLEKSLELDPTDRTARMNLGALLCQVGRLDEGVELLKDLLSEKEEDAEVHGNIASAYLAMGRTGGAVYHFERFLSLASDHPRAEEVRQILAQIRR